VVAGLQTVEWHHESEPEVGDLGDGASALLVINLGPLELPIYHSEFQS
jgi:hypothetical protein